MDKPAQPHMPLSLTCESNIISRTQQRKNITSAHLHAVIGALIEKLLASRRHNSTLYPIHTTPSNQINNNNNMASTEAASVPTGSLDQVAQDASKNPCLLDIAIAVITIVGCLMLYLLTITLVAALTALTVEIITRIIKRLGSEACDSPTRSPKKCWSWQACPEALIVLCVFSGIFCFFALMMSNVEEFFLDESSQLVRVLAVIFGFLVFDTVCILMVAIGVAIVACIMAMKAGEAENGVLLGDIGNAKMFGSRSGHNLAKDT
ncbi:hypothetical protein LTR56_012191 [Elasticomyces elasticus]|nr:hypothetical protein LTR56_012191 [Elasticomyces elasticus]KAK3652992.1 hypothetical protein LTR22_011380 [Elasticomyces elasticus]